MNITGLIVCSFNLVTTFVTKFNVQHAFALQETWQLLEDCGTKSTVYEQLLEKIRDATDTYLWSNKLMVYYVSG